MRSENGANGADASASTRGRVTAIDPAAGDETFQADAVPYLDVLYRFAFQLTHDVQTAEDLVQETMLKAYRSWSQYRSGTNLRAWLFTILRNTFLTQRRDWQERVRKVKMHDVEEYAILGAGQEADPEGDFFDRLVDDEVLQAIAELPPHYREALLLSDGEGLKYHEVAEVLGVQLGTVKSRLFRARQILQRQLYGYALEMGYLRPQAAHSLRD